MSNFVCPHCQHEGEYLFTQTFVIEEESHQYRWCACTNGDDTSERRYATTVYRGFADGYTTAGTFLDFRHRGIAMLHSKYEGGVDCPVCADKPWDEKEIDNVQLLDNEIQFRCAECRKAIPHTMKIIRGEACFILPDNLVIATLPLRDLLDEWKHFEQFSVNSEEWQHIPVFDTDEPMESLAVPTPKVEEEKAA